MNEFYSYEKIIELSKKMFTFVRGGEKMERKDISRYSALKQYLYSQLDYLRGCKENPNADQKVIEAETKIIEKIIEICENRGRY